MGKGTPSRSDRLIRTRRLDGYKRWAKLPEPSVCTECGVLYSGGHWSWKAPPPQAQEVICPACQRKLDKYPAGYVEIKGAFFREHREEIMNLIHNVDRQEKGERPLERILGIQEEKTQTVVLTSGVHIARRIGESLARAFKGSLTFEYADAEKSIRVRWERS